MLYVFLSKEMCLNPLFCSIYECDNMNKLYGLYDNKISKSFLVMLEFAAAELSISISHSFKTC